MKDGGREVYEFRDARPKVSAKEAIGFCLQQLYNDREHECTDEVCERFTYEELIGALLMARDLVKKVDELEAEIESLTEERDDEE